MFEKRNHDVHKSPTIQPNDNIFKALNSKWGSREGRMPWALLACASALQLATRLGDWGAHGHTNNPEVQDHYIQHWLTTAYEIVRMKQIYVMTVGTTYKNCWTLSWSCTLKILKKGINHKILIWNSLCLCSIILFYGIVIKSLPIHLMITLWADCWDPYSVLSYYGTQSSGKDGSSCVPWRQSPTAYLPLYKDVSHSACRNPEGEPNISPWCWGYGGEKLSCSNIPQCRSGKCMGIGYALMNMINSLSVYLLSTQHGK